MTDTLFVNRINEKQKCQTISSYHSVPYQMRITSPMPNRPSTSQTSYSEPFPNTSPYINRPSHSPTSYSEPSSSQSIRFHYISQPDLTNYTTPTIQIISNELIAPQTGQNIINEALLKTYEDFDNCKKMNYTKYYSFLSCRSSGFHFSQLSHM